MKLPKILVAGPIYDKKDYCRERWVKNIENLDYPNYRWLLVDNTPHKRYYNKLNRKYPGHIKYTPRGNNSRDAIADACNIIRKKVIDEDYDYLFMVESDVFPPKDAIWRLLRHGKSVVGLPYTIGNDKVRGLCVFIPEKLESGLLGTRRLKFEEEKSFMDGSLRRVHGMGVGCVLIHKSIVKKYPFWYSTLDDDRMKDKKTRRHPDVYFYLDLHNDAIPVYCDTSTLVYHENSDWTNVKDV